MEKIVDEVDECGRVVDEYMGEFLVKERKEKIIILYFSKWAPHLLPLHGRGRRTNKRAPPLPGKEKKNLGGEAKMRRFRVHLPWQLPAPLRSQSNRRLYLARRIHASTNSGARQGIHLSFYPRRRGD
jgi:hypothetical protein